MIVSSDQRQGRVSRSTVCSISIVQTDFEQDFPQARQVGCLFHYGQALWTKVLSLGGATEYRTNQETRQYIRKCAALAFVLLDKLNAAWVELQAAVESNTVIGADNGYFVET